MPARKKVEERQRKRQKKKEKVEDMQRKTEKRIRSEKTKIKKYMFQLENR